MSTQMHPQVSHEVSHEVSQAPIPPGTPVQSQTAIQRRPDRRLIAGVVLIAFGLLTLLATFTDSSVIGLSVVALLGVLFITWGLLARLPGLMIPGGILTGLGAGLLMSQYAFSSATRDFQGGIIVLGLGIGFLLILPLARFISPVRYWWALIPGGILSFIGVALLVGGAALNVLDALGRLWPVAPIVVGVILIWQMLRRRET